MRSFEDVAMTLNLVARLQVKDWQCAMRCSYIGTAIMMRALGLPLPMT
jgi:hypothetical protein